MLLSKLAHSLGVENSMQKWESDFQKWETIDKANLIS